MKAGPIQSSSIFKLDALIRNAAVAATVTHSEKMTWAGLNSRRMEGQARYSEYDAGYFRGKN